MMAAKTLAGRSNNQVACKALGLQRATYYRWLNPAGYQRTMPHSKTHPLALSDLEKQAVLKVLHSERFVDKSPGEIVPRILDSK